MTLKHNHYPQGNNDFNDNDNINNNNNNNNNNFALKEIEKKRRYKNLELEIQRMRTMKTEVIAVVVGALGTVKKEMVEKHQESIGESHCDKDPKHLYAGICTNPQEGTWDCLE